MNCDEAFEALTDVERCNSRDLRWHLDMCPRCRQMREVLSPALDLLRGSDAKAADVGQSEDTRTDLSSASETRLLTPEVVRLAEQTARELAAATPVRTTKPRRLHLAGWKIAVALVGSLVVALSLLTWDEPDDRAVNSPPTVTPASAGCTWLDAIENAERRRQTSSNARILALSCVACHVEEPATWNGPDVQQPARRPKTLPVEDHKMPQETGNAETAEQSIQMAQTIPKSPPGPRLLTAKLVGVVPQSTRDGIGSGRFGTSTEADWCEFRRGTTSLQGSAPSGCDRQIADSSLPARILRSGRPMLLS
jgi:hypothetical protein